MTPRPQLAAKRDQFITMRRQRGSGDAAAWQRLLKGGLGVCVWMPWGLKLTEAKMQLKGFHFGSIAERIDEAHSCIGKVLVRVNGRAVASPKDALEAAESCSEVRLQFADATAVSAAGGAEAATGVDLPGRVDLKTRRPEDERDIEY
eukprot:gene17193-biopygen5113